MVKVTGRSERNIILATLIVSCALSSVCSNIGVMTAMAPLVTAMSISAGCGSSKALLGLLFGAQFGGFIPLAGAASYATPFAAPQNMMTVGWTQYKFVDFLKIGIPMLFITYLVIVAVTPLYLPY